VRHGVSDSGLNGRLLTIDEVAVMLGVPKSTCYGWRSRGEGPRSLRVGRWVRYDPQDVADWIESQKARSAALVG
jgi:excisionase family DNA binding protein